MKCEFDLCVYNQDSNCTLDEISINQLGMCEDCMIVELDENMLEQEKQRRR